PASVPVPGTGLANGSSATPQGRFVFQDPGTGTVYDITPDTGVSAPGYLPGLPPCRDADGNPTGPRADDFHCFGTADRFNFAPYNLLLTPSERKSVFGQVQFDFTPTFGAYARVLYNERESANQAAPSYLPGLPPCRDADGNPTGPRADDFHCFGTADRFNFAPYNLLLTPSERKSVFGQVQFDFTPTFGAYARVLYNERESANQAAP